MKNLLLPLVLLVLCQTAVAQEAAPPPGPVITFHSGLIFAGSGHHMLQQLKDAGYSVKNTRGGLGAFFDNLDYRDEAAVQLGAAFSLKQKYRVKGLINFRETIANGFASNFEPLTIETSSFSLATIGYYPPLNPTVFRVGLGPAFHFVRAAPAYGGSDLVKRSYSKPGFVIEGGYNDLIGKRFSADLQVQYFYVGRGDLGSHTLAGTDQMGNSITKNINLSDTRFSSLVFSLGIGYSLGKLNVSE